MGSTYEPLRMYGALSTSDPLEWSWVEDQLGRAELYWVDVTASAARPHPRPVWGVWSSERMHLSIGTPSIRRAAEPGAGATVHLESGLDVVIVEGEVVGTNDAADVIAAYDAKYDWHYDLAQYGPLTTVAPRDVLAWRAGGPGGRDGFRKTGRWTWGSTT